MSPLASISGACLSSHVFGGCLKKARLWMILAPLSFFLAMELVFSSKARALSHEGDTWQAFERAARDGGAGRAESERDMALWPEELERRYQGYGVTDKVFFPLPGYSCKDCGGRDGEGFQPSAYRFLDGNRHRGHPAVDIFIHDRDRDSLDDETGRPVDVLALSDGVVLSVFRDWKKEEGIGAIRGGNYIWLYHPHFRSFSYYAHLMNVSVSLGEWVTGGSLIATLGRSGRNAYPVRSPTHLHLMILKSHGMAPVDPYPILRRAIFEKDGKGVP